VYSGDVVTMIGALLYNEATFGQVYNVSRDETPTLAALITLLAELVEGVMHFCGESD
jgi:hypothetical protein